MMDMEFFEPPTEAGSPWSGEIEGEYRTDVYRLLGRQRVKVTHLPTGLIGEGATRELAMMAFADLSPIEPVPNEGHPFFQRPEPRRFKYPVC
jgi:hypothetical protein